jgi:hypothetical protein
LVVEGKEMAHDQVYEAQVQRAIVHLEGAWAAFNDDPVLAWREKSGDVLRMRTRKRPAELCFAEGCSVVSSAGVG